MKPENVIVNLQGYAKLIDFGTAKIIKGRTATTVGTPHYMAPEVIQKKPYGLSVDLWSLGIMLFEFICGDVPFGGTCESVMEIYDEVLHKRLPKPSKLKSMPAA